MGSILSSCIMEIGYWSYRDFMNTFRFQISDNRDWTEQEQGPF